jgi:DNA-binding SARP family transcriptional activator
VIGDLESAEIWTTRMANTMHDHSHFNGGFYQHLRANAAAQRGDWQQAVEYARTGLVMAIEAGVPFLEGHCRIDLARALLGQSDEREWAEHLRAAHAIGQAMGSRVLEYLCLETEAKAAFQQGNEGLGLNRLAQALALSRAMDGATWLLAGPQVSSELYNRALAAGIEVEHVQRLIRRRRLAPSDPTTAAENWPWAMRIRTFGGFSLEHDGQPIVFTGKTPKKPIELLKALVASSDNVDKHWLAMQLWPDAEGDAARNDFNMTHSRLRKLLPVEDALLLSEGKFSLDLTRVWTDVWAFERGVEGCLDKLQRRADPAVIEAASARLLSLYRGELLHGEPEAPWLVAARDRLRSKFLRTLKALGAFWEVQAAWPRAQGLYERILEIDNLAEEIYRRLMRCYAHSGRPAEALHVYQRCRKMLSLVLGVAPSQETQDLYRSISSGRM